MSIGDGAPIWCTAGGATGAIGACGVVADDGGRWPEDMLAMLTMVNVSRRKHEIARLMTLDALGGGWSDKINDVWFPAPPLPTNAPLTHNDTHLSSPHSLINQSQHLLTRPLAPLSSLHSPTSPSSLSHDQHCIPSISSRQQLHYRIDLGNEGGLQTSRSITNAHR